MILRISAVLISLITSAAVYAGVTATPVPFTHACEKLLTLINKQTLTPEQITSFAHETFEETKDLALIKKQFKFIQSVQGEGMSPPERSKLCIKVLQDKFEESELKEKAPKKPDVESSDTKVATEIFANVQNESSNVVKELPKKIRQGHCKYGQDLECAINSQIPVTVGISSLEELERNMNTPKIEAFSENDCACFEQNLERANKNKNEIINNAAKEYEKVDKAIAEASGKKFINDFANFQEDLGYFETTTAWALQKNTDLKLSKEFLCTESKDFKAMIDETCRENKMTEGKEERIAALLGVYGKQNVADANVLKNGLNDLLIDIKKPDEATNYTRQKYDNFRHGLSKPLVGQPELLILDQLTAKIVQNSDIKKDLKIFMDNAISPLAAIEQIISSEKYNKVIMKYLGEIDNPRCHEIVSKLTSLKGVEFEKEKTRVFDLALTIHPGFKSLLLDPRLFGKTVAKMKGGDDGIIEKAEENLDIANHFTERCQKLKKNLAEAVCTNPTDLRNKVKKSEMIRLLGANESIGAQNEDAIDLLICSTNYNKFVSGSAFDGLVIDGSRAFLMSDYHVKAGNDGTTSFFSNAAKLQKDPGFEARMNKIASAFDYERVSTGTSNTSEAAPKTTFNESDFVTRLKQKFSSDKVNSEIAPMSQEKNEPVPESIMSNAATKISQINSQFKSNATNSDIPKYVTQPFEESKGQEFLGPRDELKNILSGSDQKKVSSQLNDINDEEAQELINLRKQLLKNKDEISAMKLEQESRKMRDLQNQFEALESKYEDLRKEKNQVTDRSFVPSASDIGSGFKNQNSGFMNERNPAAGIKPTSVINGGGYVQKDSETQTQVGLVRETVRTNNSLNVDLPSADVAGTKLVITSSIKDGIKTVSDPSQELITYLTKNETDDETLRNLKESGMIYTYDLKENGKIVQVSKLIKYSQLSDEAKILVDNKLLLLSSKKPTALNQLEKDKMSVKRKYSYQALKLEILKVK